MALGALSLSVTAGVQGRPFQAKIVGLTTGRVEVLVDGSPGFSTVNGNLMSQGLPYPVSTAVLREYEPGVGQGYRDSRIDIDAATPQDLRTQAIASLGPGRTLRRFRTAGERQADGSFVYKLFVEDDLGATAALDVGSGGGGAPSPTISGTPAASRVGSAYTFTPTAASGTGPYAFTLAAGTLPTGLVLNPSTGAITGTPTGI
jgi:hypothetical protein